jgi:hypothetical protein
MAHILEDFQLCIGDVVGQKFIGGNGRGLILFSGEHERGLLNVFQAIGNVPVENAVSTGGSALTGRERACEKGILPGNNGGVQL